MDAIPVYKTKWKWAILGLGLSFLYLPILSLIIYSFNANRLVTVWSGFSTKWYGALFDDALLMNGITLSLLIGFMSATAAVVLGTLAAFVMTRYNKFRGETSFAFMITAPLVMPEVITGLSLLLLFISLGQVFDLFSQRGMLTIWIAHVTFCTAYVSVVVSSRLRELDKSIEEAAMDLGATPLKVFFVITLPTILPAIVAGWLLAFTLSLDDLVIASFVSGPSATTLPMVVFSSVRLGVSPKINALATLIIGVVSVATFIAWWIMAKAEKRRLQELRTGNAK
ncbi:MULTISPECIES: ABC transporter permease subunit [unclassified Agarivorans]|uniref:ABC transporter permease subunit n=1 Tax=unclassified Agarivorans TaxID=2636026 RepID=UPI0010F203A2|nr:MULTISPECIES: ABC transporter permease subunit [unclassified Agarivorans]MDO6685389.1 ABC transporter permease subunit [Agarivorans sp. 3_MG-2023]MDO6715775.1 ABC transporter permease subunit [Agarivorans sp. 2_MG-2023]MDO6766109.1 ABC transporter permease subunit [Agarivorans sp. 1_MG-2023]GDY25199.1 putrescine ABC transporter permease PotI [Agarivorans sp. Toyoura001]